MSIWKASCLEARLGMRHKQHSINQLHSFWEIRILAAVGIDLWKTPLWGKHFPLAGNSLPGGEAETIF